MDTKHLFAKVASAFKESNTAASRLACPGIVVVAVSDDLLHLNRPLYVNQVARKLMALISSRDDEANIKNGLPREVASLCFQIQELLGSQEVNADRKQFQLSQTIVTQDGQLRLRGFGLPGASSFERSRIVLLIEECGPGSMKIWHRPKTVLSFQNVGRLWLRRSRWHWSASSASKAIHAC